MKIGDLVSCSYGIGVVVSKALRHDGPLFKVMLSAFPERKIWVRSWEIKVFNESR